MSELKPCPFCGSAPQSLERPDNIDGTRFFYALACYCGGYSACAHKMAVEPTPEQAKRAAIEAWNRRAQPAQAGHDGLVWREIERGADYIKMEGRFSGQPAQPLITSETGNTPDQGASAITSESGKAGQVLTDEEIQAAWVAHGLDDCAVEDFARAIEQAVLAKRVPMPPEDWSVFNSGAEVASGLTWAEAWDYMTPSRIERGWTAVCVANKSNIGIVGEKGGA